MARSSWPISLQNPKPACRLAGAKALSKSPTIPSTKARYEPASPVQGQQETHPLRPRSIITVRQGLRQKFQNWQTSQSTALSPEAQIRRVRGILRLRRLSKSILLFCSYYFLKLIYTSTNESIVIKASYFLIIQHLRLQLQY